MFGSAGTRQLDAMELAPPFAHRVTSLRELIAPLRPRGHRQLERDIYQHLKGDAGYRAIQAVNGIGKVSAAVLVAEIGDVSRFPTAGASVLLVTAPRPATASLISRHTTGGSPNKAPGWSPRRSSKGSAATTAAASSTPKYRTIAKRHAARTRPRSRWRAWCSRSSTTAYRDGEIRCLTTAEAA